MSRKPTSFVRRGVLIEMLRARGFSKFDVCKWLRDGIIPEHTFPEVPKKPGERAYYSLATVGQKLGIDLLNPATGSEPAAPKS